jgi:hypothetical protein
VALERAAEQIDVTVVIRSFFEAQENSLVEVRLVDEVRTDLLGTLAFTLLGKKPSQSRFSALPEDAAELACTPLELLLEPNVIAQAGISLGQGLMNLGVRRLFASQVFPRDDGAFHVADRIPAKQRGTVEKLAPTYWIVGRPERSLETSEALFRVELVREQGIEPPEQLGRRGVERDRAVERLERRIAVPRREQGLAGGAGEAQEGRRVDRSRAERLNQ